MCAGALAGLVAMERRWCRKCNVVFAWDGKSRCRGGHPDFMFSRKIPAGAREEVPPPPPSEGSSSASSSPEPPPRTHIDIHPPEAARRERPALPAAAAAGTSATSDPVPVQGSDEAPPIEYQEEEEGGEGEGEEEEEGEEQEVGPAPDRPDMPTDTSAPEPEPEPELGPRERALAYARHGPGRSLETMARAPTTSQRLAVRRVSSPCPPHISRSG
eukprot:COSAG01_NODE_1459_length_10250_cov_5.016846_1_plen_215_part_00